MLLGDTEVAVADLFAALLRRVAAEASAAPASPAGRRGAHLPGRLGRPAPRRAARRRPARRPRRGRAWSTSRSPRPRTASRSCASRSRPAAGLAVFDFGGGTLDVAVVRRDPGRPARARRRRPRRPRRRRRRRRAGRPPRPAGRAAQRPGLWQRLRDPRRPANCRDRRAFWAEVRAAKEMLSRASAAPVHVPGMDERAAPDPRRAGAGRRPADRPGRRRDPAGARRGRASTPAGSPASSWSAGPAGSRWWPAGCTPGSASHRPFPSSPSCRSRTAACSRPVAAVWAQTGDRRCRHRAGRPAPHSPLRRWRRPRSARRSRPRWGSRGRSSRRAARSAGSRPPHRRLVRARLLRPRVGRPEPRSADQRSTELPAVPGVHHAAAGRAGTRPAGRTGMAPPGAPRSGRRHGGAGCATSCSSWSS